MSQYSILDFLERHKKTWFIASEINKRMGLSIGSTINSLKRMRKHNIVRSRERANQPQHALEYKHKGKNET